MLGRIRASRGTVTAIGASVFAVLTLASKERNKKSNNLITVASSDASLINTDIQPKPKFLDVKV